MSHWKSLEQLKTYLLMSSTVFCPQFSSQFVNKMALSTSRVLWAASSEVFNATCMKNQVSTSTTTQKNVFTVQQIQPQAIFAERILTSLKAAHLTSTFSVVISRRSQGWMRTDRWAIEAHTGITYIAVALLVTFHKLLFQPKLFHWACMKNFVFIYWRSAVSDDDGRVFWSWLV